MIGLGFDLQIDGSLKDEDQLAAAVFVPVGVIGAAGLIGAVEKLVSRDRGEGNHAIVFGQAGLVAQGGHVRDPADIAQMGGGGVQQGVELDLQAVGDLPDGGDGGGGFRPFDLTEHGFAHAGHICDLAETEPHAATQALEIVADADKFIFSLAHMVLPFRFIDRWVSGMLQKQVDFSCAALSLANCAKRIKEKFT